MVKVFLGLGSNVGDSLATLRQAFENLAPHFQELVPSSIVLSEPMYVLDQPKFYNQVLMGQTDLAIRDLLHLAQHIQVNLGRTQTYRNGPRVLDIDILYYGDIILDEPDLTIPHPRLHERLFVLQPLAELDPLWVCPKSQKTAGELLKECYQNQNITKALPIVPSPLIP